MVKYTTLRFPWEATGREKIRMRNKMQLNGASSAAHTFCAGFRPGLTPLGCGVDTAP